MKLKVLSEHLNGLRVLEPSVFEDPRGFFMETFHAGDFAELGLPATYAQDNQSRSRRNVLRGLHFQWDPPQEKLVRVSSGAAWLVAVDVRQGSPTLGRWHGIEVSADNHLMVWAPAGFARGFCVLSERADVQYKCSGTYNPGCEAGIRWDDPDVGIEWPIEVPLLSDKDAAAQTLAEWLTCPESAHFRF